MWPFTCRVCQEKDKRIQDLKETLTHQRLQLSPPARVSKYELEQDYVLNGANAEQVQPQSIDEVAQAKEEAQQAMIQLEREMMLGGDTIEIPVPSGIITYES